jgi:hypothetical protein
MSGVKFLKQVPESRRDFGFIEFQHTLDDSVDARCVQRDEWPDDDA